MLSCGGALSSKKIGGGVSAATSGATVQGPSGSGAIGPTQLGSGSNTASNGGVTASGTTSVTFPLTVVAQSGGATVNIATASITVP
jgi:hypothetical protein